MQTWTFTRDEHPLTITRTRTEDGYLLGISGDGPARSYFFADLGKLESFQADFEQFLIGTGWTFLAFSPDRRTGHERRHFSRLITDRRRWWTDGVRPQAQAQPREDDDYGGRRARVRRRSPR